MPNTFQRAALIGAVAGIRSMTAPAAVSRRLSAGHVTPDVDSALAFMGKKGVAHALAIAAAGELAADKVPFVPNRTDAAPLIFRAVSGAVCGATVADADDESPFAGAIIGSLAAVLSAYLFFNLRREITRRTAIPDTCVALVEDALALTAAQYAAAEIN